ncbi:hypothetical protein FRB97_006584 [Tulasnella sp. 331]|nr:hypothetical protein FRB97_006584 [Tulasnella sp. 331]
MHRLVDVVAKGELIDIRIEQVKRLKSCGCGYGGVLARDDIPDRIIRLYDEDELESSQPTNAPQNRMVPGQDREPSPVPAVKRSPTPPSLRAPPPMPTSAIEPPAVVERASKIWGKKEMRKQSRSGQGANLDLTTEQCNTTNFGAVELDPTSAASDKNIPSAAQESSKTLMEVEPVRLRVMSQAASPALRERSPAPIAGAGGQPPVPPHQAPSLALVTAPATEESVFQPKKIGKEKVVSSAPEPDPSPAPFREAEAGKIEDPLTATTIMERALEVHTFEPVRSRASSRVPSPVPRQPSPTLILQARPPSLAPLPRVTSPAILPLAVVEEVTALAGKNAKGKTDKNINSALGLDLMSSLAEDNRATVVEVAPAMGLILEPEELLEIPIHERPRSRSPLPALHEPSCAPVLLARSRSPAPSTRTPSPIPVLAPQAETAEPWNGEDESESTVDQVPLQIAFSGPSYVLNSSTAAIPCSDLDAPRLLSKVNEVLQTDYDLSAPRAELLKHCLDSFVDFGHAYALLHPRWHLEPSEALQDVEICRTADEELRRDAIDNDIIADPDIPPRRIWDIWSNRVVPIWMTTPYQGQRRKTYFAVSHSWMDDSLRATINTPINGGEWPVPVPMNTTLERVRSELLNYASKLDVNLVWIDVLCLRQEGVPEKEKLRLDEWKLDVPTIGALYPGALRVVYYYSGLGRPFEIGDPTSPRHWQNRAWTLQETTPNRIVAGISSRSPSMPGIDTRHLPVDDAIRPFYEKIDIWESFSHVVDSVYVVLDAMRHRSATSELDKIAGLNYYLAKFSSLPAYIRSEDPESAWSRLIRATHPMQRGDLFFIFPEPGNGRHVWCPSWKQIKEAQSLPQQRTIRQYVYQNDEAYEIAGRCIQQCYVDGLTDLGNGSIPRRGNILISGKDDTEHTVPVLANHKCPIADGSYMLIGGSGPYLAHWVIGKRRGSDLVEKVSVVEIVEKEFVVKMGHLSEDKVVNRLL